MALTRNSKPTRTSATTSGSTSTSTATTPAASEPATKPAGRRWWRNCSTRDGHRGLVRRITTKTPRLTRAQLPFSHQEGQKVRRGEVEIVDVNPSLLFSLFPLLPFFFPSDDAHPTNRAQQPHRMARTRRPRRFRLGHDLRRAHAAVSCAAARGDASANRANG